jgi:hypothetical protein
MTHLTKEINTVFGSDRYREDADIKSWNRFIGFLGETLE